MKEETKETARKVPLIVLAVLILFILGVWTGLQIAWDLNRVPVIMKQNCTATEAPRDELSDEIVQYAIRMAFARGECGKAERIAERYQVPVTEDMRGVKCGQQSCPPGYEPRKE